MNLDKESLYAEGLKLLGTFCRINRITPPAITRLAKTERLYHLATCAYYRPKPLEQISIMVEKCAHPGYGGRAWSWPSYAIDRTPYGVLQHELGHHVDYLMSPNATTIDGLYSKQIYDLSNEAPLTGYLGTDKNKATFYMEWFAEIFRLYVTNPDLCSLLRPYAADAISKKLDPIPFSGAWRERLTDCSATERIIEQARKKIGQEHRIL